MASTYVVCVVDDVIPMVGKCHGYSKTAVPVCVYVGIIGLRKKGKRETRCAREQMVGSALWGQRV